MESLCIHPFNFGFFKQTCLVQIILLHTLHINKKICQHFLCIFDLSERSDIKFDKHSFPTDESKTKCLTFMKRKNHKQWKKICNINYPASFTFYILIDLDLNLFICTWLIRKELKIPYSSNSCKLPLHFDSWGTSYNSHLENFLMTCTTKIT